MKKYLLFLSLGLLVACNKPAAEQSATTENPAAAISDTPAAPAEDPNLEKAPETPAADMTGWKTLAQDNYSIQYPADWDINQDPNATSKFALLSKRESAKDQFMENVNLVTEDLTGKGDITISVYAEASESQIKAGIDKANILQSNPMKGKNGVHHKIVYTGEQMGFAMQFEQYYYVVGNTAYVLTFTTEAGRFEEFKPVGETILNSFVIK